MGALGVVVWMIYKPHKGLEPIRYFPEKIESFCVDNLCLKKDGDNWFINEKIPADNEIVGDFAKKLSQISFIELISQNRDKFADLGFDENKIIVSAGGKNLQIGKVSSNYDGTYVLGEDGNSVYKTAEIIDRDNAKNENFWQKKFLINLPAMQIKKLVGSFKKKTVELKPVDKVTNLTVIRFLPDFKPTTKDNYILEIETENNKVKLILGRGRDKKATVYWATVDEKYYYEITKADFAILTDKIK